MATMAAQRRQMNATAVEDDALADEQSSENSTEES
jgi:hypothetical protein